MTLEMTTRSENKQPRVTFATEHVFDIPLIQSDKLDLILEKSVEFGYRDIYIASDDFIRVRKHNKRLIASRNRLTHEEVRELLVQMSSENEVSLTQKGEEAGGRKTISKTSNENELLHFRYSIHQVSDDGHSGLDCAIRPIAEIPPTLQEVGLDHSIIDHITSLYKGLILLIGATGEGKTSTLAAIIRYVLERDSNIRILEFARPPEFTYHKVEQHPSNSIKHSEIAANEESGGDLRSYEIANALAMRKAADWFAIGEMTESQSFSSALELSNTGHIVSSTVHANDVSGVFPRVYQKFDPSERDYQLFQLINEGEIFCAQKLVNRKGGGLVAIRELLINTPESKTRLKKCNGIDEVYSMSRTIMTEQGTTFRQQALRALKADDITLETYEYFIKGLPNDG
jgi:defect-in-organelle-trafficking protein DotB